MPLQGQCYSNARLKPDILCVQGQLHLSDPPQFSHPSTIIQYIEFTFCHDRFSPDKVTQKIAKYEELIQQSQDEGWNTAPKVILTAGPRGGIHLPSINILKNKFKILQKSIKQCMIKIHKIAVKYLCHIILNKRSL